jgi:hypothetical protein
MGRGEKVGGVKRRWLCGDGELNCVRVLSVCTCRGRER